MTSTNERIKILKMIESGKISAEEGTRLLNALTQQTKKAPRKIESEARWLRVRVVNLDTGKETVRVNIPMSLVDVGMRMGARFVPDIEQESAMEEMAEAIRLGLTGKILDVVDEEDRERVEIFVE